MPIQRQLLLLSSTLLLLLSCATAPLPVHDAQATALSPETMEFDSPSPVTEPARNPYAPTRVAKSPHYSWQSGTPRKCEPEPSAKEPDARIVLTFSGSVGVFPPIPETLGEPEPSKPNEPIDTWGSGQLRPAESRSPDLVVAGLRPAFRRCFSRWLNSKADAEGSVRLALELGCAGEVQAISADVHGVDEPTLECLFTVVAPAQFGPPASGHATLQVPVVFKNASR